jgi:hypothetical protein
MRWQKKLRPAIFEEALVPSWFSEALSAGASREELRRHVYDFCKSCLCHSPQLSPAPASEPDDGWVEVMLELFEEACLPLEKQE